MQEYSSPISVKEQEWLSPTAILGGILSFLPEEYKIKEKELHIALYDMKKSSKPKLLDAFVFDERDMFPYSPVLGEAVLNLLDFSCLEFNFSDSGYMIGPSLKNYFDKSIKSRLSENQINEMCKIAEAIRNPS